MRDYDIRILLRETILSKYFKDSKSKVVEELKLPLTGAVIDMAVINGNLHGFEIKSAVDTLQRLPYQLDAYSKVFDFLTVVTEEKHFKKVMEILPFWVGVYTCSQRESGPKIKKVRESKRNSFKEGFYVAKLLWREEILTVLNELNIEHRKMDRNWILCELLAANIALSKLSNIVRKILQKRPEWKNNATIDYGLR